MTERRGLALGTKLFLGTAIVLLLVLASAVWIITWLGERIAVRDAREKIAASSALEVASQQRQFRELGLLAEMPFWDDRTRQAIEAGNLLGLLDAV